MAIATELAVTQTSDADLIASTIFGDGVTIVSSSMSGNAVQSGIYSGATTTTGGTAPSDTGVIFSTGNTADYSNSSGTTDTNTAANTGTNHSGTGDADLTALGGNTTFDAIIFESTFIPTGDYLTMQFTFSSEEYLEYVNGGVNDVLGVWVNDVFVELTPSGETVSIDTVNNGVNPNLYVDNPAVDDIYNTEMDGFTVTLSMKAPVNSGVENTIKIGLADGGDGIYDSNVLIAADSLQTVALAMEDTITLPTNSSKVLDVLGNDIDQSGGGLAVTQINGQDIVVGQTITLGTGEQVTLNPDGTLTIESDGDVTESVLTYEVTDSNGVTDVGYITIETIAAAIADGTVQGTAGDDQIQVGYLGDPDGDLVDNNDSLGVAGTTGDGDYILGYSGDDTINAGAGDDIVYAGSDNDSVSGSTGNDTVYLEDGNDTFGDFSTEAGNDTVYGGAGSDSIDGGGDDDEIYGGADDDTLTGSTGNDTLYGGTGDDTFLITDDHDGDTIFGGEDSDGNDVDTVVFADSASPLGVTVTATGDEAGSYDFDGTTGTGSYSEIESFNSQGGDDTFNLGLDNSGVTVDTWTGDDSITTGSGDDTILSGQGADTINTGAGNDQIDLGNNGAGSPDGDADVIILQDGFGDDTVTSFDAPTPNGDGTFTGIDTLDVSGLYDLPLGDPDRTPVLTNDVVVTDDGFGNAVLTFPNGETITLDGINATDAENPFYLNALGIPMPDGTIEGTSGNDTINGSYTGDPDGDLVDAGDAILTGDTGDDDLIEANDGDDSVNAGAGNDEVYGGGDNDTLDGGAGNDTLYGGTGDDQLLVASGAGSDLIEGGEDVGDGDVDTLAFTDTSGPTGVQVTMTGDEAGTYTFPTDGGSGAFSEIEEVSLTDQSDEFDGLLASGGSTVDGGAGDDTLTGGNGSDSFEGGAGIDTLNGNVGDDSLSGGSGDDLIYGDQGDDSIDGGADNDEIYGGADNDFIGGGTGDDSLYGGSGDDTLTGGDGSDTLSGGADQDVIYGGAGDIVDGSETGVDNDTLIVSGVDYIDYDSGNPENGTVYFDGGGSLTFTNIENVIVSDRDGTVSGTEGDDVINVGYAGDPDGDMVDDTDAIIAGHEPDDDLIEAGAGNDTVFAGAGDDIVYGDTGGTTGTLDWSTVTVAGGDGTTTVTAGSESVDVTITGDGVVRDTIYGSGDYYAPTTTQSSVPVSTLVEFDTTVANVSFELFDVDSNGTSFDDQYTIIALDADGNQVPVTFSGLTHHVVNGNTIEGQDDLDGGGSGTQDAVTVTIPDGVVSIEIIYEPGSEVANTGLSGIGDLTFDIVPTATNDDLYGGAGNDTMFGEYGDDTLNGGTGEDVLFGGIGEDLIFGGGDNDTIDGGAGNDIINGGTGDDVLSGGDDEDTFVLEAGFGSDTITGGEGGTDNDEIASLQNVDMTVTTTGDEAGTISDGTSTATFSEIETIETEDGNDTIDLSSDSSGMTVDAGAGNDTITSGSGDDVLIAGQGNDTINLGDGFGTDTITAGEDPSTMDIDVIDAGGMTSDVTLDFTGPEAGTLSDGTNTATFTQTEAVILGSGDDTVIGGTGNDVVYAGSGSDTMSGGTGQDTLYGGSGDDNITFAEGDSVSGGSGNDTFTLEDLGEPTNGTITIDGGSGDETGGDTLQLGSLGVLTQDVRDTFVDDGTGSFSGSILLDDGTILNFSEIENIICFTLNTRIATPKGLVEIQDLEVGDMVVTRDHGLQPIRWIEGRTVPAVDRFAPVRIRKNVLEGQDRDLIVSPQHRVLFQGYRAELLFGESEVLVAATHLVDGLDVTQDEAEMVTYMHMLFDQHEVIYAEGAATESFHPGDIGFSAVGDAAREELFAIFPELRVDPRAYGSTARRCLKSHEAKLIRT